MKRQQNLKMIGQGYRRRNEEERRADFERSSSSGGKCAKPKTSIAAANCEDGACRQRVFIVNDPLSSSKRVMKLLRYDKILSMHIHSDLLPIRNASALYCDGSHVWMPVCTNAVLPMLSNLQRQLY